MEYPMNKTNEKIDYALLSEIADVALTHGYNESANLPEELSLPRWYERARALASLLPSEADLALTHGSERDNDLPSKQEIYREAA